MNTPSHFVINAALRKKCFKDSPKSAVLWGSIAPDIPLYLLTLFVGLYLTIVKNQTFETAFRYIFDTLFFENIWWIIFHNVLHSPVVLIGLIIAATHKPSTKIRRWIMWFSFSALTHTVLDIVTHADDGPLLFFPLNMNYRFGSPISYWDPNYFGQQFAIFETVLFITLTTYLIWPWVTKKVRAFKHLS